MRGMPRRWIPAFAGMTERCGELPGDPLKTEQLSGLASPNPSVHGAPMTGRQRTIPLFPLNVVLFPSGFLPLHIFEERYKLMVQHCLDADSEFGVVLIKSGLEVGGTAEPHAVGTVARIVDVKRADDGRMNLMVTGRDRFRIDAVLDRQPYMEGVVDILDDGSSETPDADLLAEMRQAVAEQIRLLHGLRGGWVRDPQTPEDPAELSWLVCTLVQAGNEVKQALLEEPSNTARLRAQLPLLRSNASVLRERIAERLGR